MVETADSGIAIFTSNATAGYLQFADGTSGAEEYRGFIKYDHSTNAMSFSTNSTARTEAEMTIISSGNVGIGTATPDAQLQVSTTDNLIANFQNTRNGATQLFFGNDFNFDATNFTNYSTTLFFRGDKQNRYTSAGVVIGPLASIATIYDNTTFSADSQQGAGALVFSTRQGTATTASDTLTERLRINSIGDIGINTATPNIGSLVGTVLTINGATQSNLEMASAGASRARIASSSSDTTFETRSALPLVFGTDSTARWQITSTGIFQSSGLQTIQTSTGNLTLATGGGNGNIILSPNGTGNVGVGTTPSGAKLDVLGNFRVRRDINANQYFDITAGGGFVNLLAYNGNSSTIFQELIFQSGNTTSTVERWKITSTGVLQSNGAQTIQTSTGNLILTSADNTGIVDIQRNIRANGAELRLSNASNSSSWVPGDIVGTINFYLPNDTSTTQPIRSQIQAISTSGTTYPF